MQLTELGNAVSVKFDTNGGSSVDNQYILEGESYTISKPADPVKDDGSPLMVGMPIKNLLYLTTSRLLLLLQQPFC